MADSDITSLRVGQKLGRYELLVPVGNGGTGQVWAGRLRGARGFQKLVAIKTLPSGPSSGPRAEPGQLERARIAALIQHSNVAQTLELGEHEGTLYLVTEWVDGETVADLTACAARAGGVPQLIAVNLTAQMLRGLQVAHELSDERLAPLGIVHRDLSPETVLVTYSGVAKLVDFGIFKAVPSSGGGAGPSRGGANEGSGYGRANEASSYLAPEQLTLGVVDRRADLFAVGVMLYALTTGKHPFEATDAPSANPALASDEPVRRPSLWKPNYSRTLEAVVLKALEKDRDRRWPSAGEMRLALQRGVPQAFELGFETQLRTFMADTVGERAARKRDALRRAELAVDARAMSAVPGFSSTSATSLRAIAIDTSERSPESRSPPSVPMTPSQRSAAVPPSSPAPRSANAARKSRSQPITDARSGLGSPARAAARLPLQGRRARRRTRLPLFIGVAAAAALIIGLAAIQPRGGASSPASSADRDMVDLTRPRVPAARAVLAATSAIVAATSATGAPTPSASTPSSSKPVPWKPASSTLSASATLPSAPVFARASSSAASSNTRGRPAAAPSRGPADRASR